MKFRIALLVGTLILVGCASVLTFDEMISSLDPASLVRDRMLGCASPFVADMYKHTYANNVVVFGSVDQKKLEQGEDAHGPVLAVLFFADDQETLIKAIVRVRETVRIFETHEQLVDAFPSPCDILWANVLTETKL